MPNIYPDAVERAKDPDSSSYDSSGASYGGTPPDPGGSSTVIKDTSGATYDKTTIVENGSSRTIYTPKGEMPPDEPGMQLSQEQVNYLNKYVEEQAQVAQKEEPVYSGAQHYADTHSFEVKQQVTPVYKDGKIVGYHDPYAQQSVVLPINKTVTKEELQNVSRTYQARETMNTALEKKPTPPKKYFLKEQKTPSKPIPFVVNGQLFVIDYKKTQYNVKKWLDTKEIEAGRQGKKGLATIYGTGSAVVSLGTEDKIKKVAKAGGQAAIFAGGVTLLTTLTGIVAIPVLAIGAGTVFAASKIGSVQDKYAAAQFFGPVQYREQITEGAALVAATVGGARAGSSIASNYIIKYKTWVSSQRLKPTYQKEYIWDKEVITKRPLRGWEKTLIKSKLITESQKSIIARRAGGDIQFKASTSYKSISHQGPYEYQTQLIPKSAIYQNPSQPLKYKYGGQPITQYELISKVTGQSYWGKGNKFKFIFESNIKPTFSTKILKLLKNKKGSLDISPFDVLTEANKGLGSDDRMSGLSSLLSKQKKIYKSYDVEYIRKIGDYGESSKVTSAPKIRLVTGTTNKFNFGIFYITEESQAPTESTTTKSNLGIYNGPTQEIRPVLTDITDSMKIQINSPIQEVRQYQAQIPINKSSSTQAQIQIPMQDPVLDITPISPPVQITQPAPQTKPLPGPSITPQLQQQYNTTFLMPEFGQGQKIKRGGFNIYVRRKKMFKQIGTSQTAQGAYTIGKQRVRSTAAASFKVTQAGQTVRKPGLLSSMFYESRKEPGVFIQKPQFRISTPGEKKEITYKGLFVRKNKSRGFRL